MPSVPTLLSTVAIDVTTVAPFDGIAYANDSAALDAIDIATVYILQSFPLAGNTTTTDPITVTLTPDTAPPTLLTSNIVAGSTNDESYRSFDFTFSKPIDVSKLSVSDFIIVVPDGSTADATSEQTRASGRVVSAIFPQLTLGADTLEVIQSGFADFSGNVLGGGGNTVTLSNETVSVSSIDLQSATLQLSYGAVLGHGTVNVDGGAVTLEGGSLTTADLAGVSDAGGLTLTGTVDLACGTLAIAPSTRQEPTSMSVTLTAQAFPADDWARSAAGDLRPCRTGAPRHPVRRGADGRILSRYRQPRAVRGGSRRAPAVPRLRGPDPLRLAGTGHRRRGTAPGNRFDTSRGA